MDHPLRLDYRTENLLRHHPWGVPGDVMDPHQHKLHVRLIHYVSLGAGYPF